MDTIIDLNDDEINSIIIIFDYLFTLEGKDKIVTDIKDAAIDSTNEEKIIVYDDKDELRYNVYTGRCEHSDYKSGYLLNYLKVAVRARNDYVGKVLIYLLHDILNDNLPEDTINKMNENLQGIYPDGFIINGIILPLGKYPLNIILDEMANYSYCVAIKHIIKTNKPLIHELRGRDTKIIIKKQIINIDIWDIYRVALAYEACDFNTKYEELNL